MNPNPQRRARLPIATSSILAVFGLLTTGVLVTDLPAQAAKLTLPADTADVKTIEHGVKYSILRQGSGKTSPLSGDAAIITFSEWLPDGTLITDQSKGGIRLVLDVTRAPRALAIAAKLLTKGGKIKLTVPPQMAYGPNGVAGRIPRNATMIYVVELLDYQYLPKPVRFAPGDASKIKATKSGIKYEVLLPGSGENVGAKDIVNMESTVYSLDGEMQGGSFQSGKSEEAPIGMLAHPFLREILPMMKKGALWRVVAPANLTVEQVTADTVWYIRMMSNRKSPDMPKLDEDAMTTTKSGLQTQRLIEGKGDRPRQGYLCEVEYDFWRLDKKMYVSGSSMYPEQMPRMKLVIGESPHAFLDEIVGRLQLGEQMLVEVPRKNSAPRMHPFDTLWRVKLVKFTKPLPIPKFELPADSELTRTQSGLRYKVLSRGDGKGASPRQGDPVRVHYAGWKATGELFDASYKRGEMAVFQVGQVIPGWNEGLSLMHPGDHFLFVIPGNLGYGQRGAPPKIGPNETLVFKVQLDAVGPEATKPKAPKKTEPPASQPAQKGK